MRRLLYFLFATVTVLSLKSQTIPPDSIRSVAERIGKTVTLNQPKESFKPVVYTYDIAENIAAPIWRTTKMAFKEADSLGAELMIIRMNTYGGEVSAADSIRTKILNAKMPVYMFIDDNAA